MTAIVKADFEKLVASGYDCDTEVDIKSKLGMHIYSAIYEENGYSNGFINIHRPWSVYVCWYLYGPLRERICGKWCVTAHFESIGEAWSST